MGIPSGVFFEHVLLYLQHTQIVDSSRRWGMLEDGRAELGQVTLAGCCFRRALSFEGACEQSIDTY
ncbi:hypothetical protein DSLASN_36990 [Desulfoluna limicola]|uniref:Uncharacterized protein n=1 Tax=Desulfoluna limicola TaxID=2810562 RepID=A0ABM7PLF5_9BACT|nr:hypothetical protein DSLASN_36990 [Desulfoluna limicola]